LNDVPVKYEPSVSVLVVFAVMVMLALPLNDVPLIVRAVCSVVAVAALPVVELEVVAFPDKAAVIVPALKLPEASLATMADAVFALVALDVTVNVAALD
jgi:hypothetical protein